MLDRKNVNGLLRLAAWIGLGLLCMTAALAQTVVPSALTFKWPVVSTTGQLGSFIVLNGLTAPRPSTYRVDWTAAGTAPTGCTFNVQGSADNVTWTNLDGAPAVSCTTSGGEVIAASPVLMLRVNVASYTAGDGTTAVKFSYTGGAGAVGAAKTIANVAHKWLNSYNAATATFTQTQPASADLSDLGAASGAAQLNGSGQLSLAELGSGTPAAGKYVDGAAGAWTALPTDAATVNTNTFPAAGGFTSGGIPYFSSTTAMGSSALLATHGLMIGAGAGAAPKTIAVCATNAPVIGQVGADPICGTILQPGSMTQWGFMYASTSTQMASTAALTANALVKAGSSAAPAASSVVDNATKVSTTEFLKTGNTQLLTADATGITATTPGTVVFTWGALPVSTNFSLHCSILYSQATAAVADGLAIQAATNAATRIDAWGAMYTTNPASTTVTASLGSTLNLTTTTATGVVTATPGATATVFQATLDATVQAGASAPTLNVLMFTGNASDAITPKAGSYCTLMP